MNIKHVLPTGKPFAVACALMALATILSHAAHSEDIPILPDTGRYTYDKTDFFIKHPLEIHYWRPGRITANTRVFFIMHGTLRNARDYLDTWKKAVAGQDVILIAPRFREAYYPGSDSYQLGMIHKSCLLSVADIHPLKEFLQTLNRDQNDDSRSPSKRIMTLMPDYGKSAIKNLLSTKRFNPDDLDAFFEGLNELISNPKLYDRISFTKIRIPRPAMKIYNKYINVSDFLITRTRLFNRKLIEQAFPKFVDRYTDRLQHKSIWTYSAIERVFDDLKTRLKLKTDKYSIYGHSAGAQFVQRMVLLCPESRIETAIAANAGRYLLIDDKIKWPYGLKGIRPSRIDVKLAFTTNFTVMLGTDDNDKNADHLIQTDKALEQGKSRYDRGIYFINHAKKIAQQNKFLIKWQLVEVPEAEHSNDQMSEKAAELLFKKSNPAKEENN